MAAHHLGYLEVRLLRQNQVLSVGPITRHGGCATLLQEIAKRGRIAAGYEMLSRGAWTMAGFVARQRDIDGSRRVGDRGSPFIDRLIDGA